MARLFSIFVLTILICTFCEAFPLSGMNGVLESSSTLHTPGWHYITGWNTNDALNKPGLFIIGLTTDSQVNEISMSQPGIYYISYNLKLQSLVKANYTAAVIIDKDTDAGLSLQSEVEPNTVEFDVSGSGFIRLTKFNVIQIGLRIKHTRTANVTLKPASSLSLTQVTTSGTIPAFSFSLKADQVIGSSSFAVLRDWSQRRMGEFHSTVGFKAGRSFVQPICTGVYLVAANIIIRGYNNASIFAMQIVINGVVIKELRELFLNQTTKTVNIYQIMHLEKADTLSLKFATFGRRTIILRQSTWSAALINKVSQHATGFNSILRNNFSVSVANSHIAISSWPTIFNRKTEFKTPLVFNRLVRNRDFNPSSRGIYLVTASIQMECLSVIGKMTTVSIYSQATSFAIVTKTITGIRNATCRENDKISVSLTTAVDLLSTESISVTIKSTSGPTVILAGSSFSVCQLAILYPGMLGRLITPARYITNGWQVLRNWKTDEVKGGYDFFVNSNATTGKYTIPFSGIYLLSANIITMDLNQVEALISIGGSINIANGLYTKVGNPTNVMTINIAGIAELQKGQDVSVMINSPSDQDWSVKENGGFSVAYLGWSSHCFRAYLKSLLKATKTGWTQVNNWQTLVSYGNSFVAADGKFNVPVSGVYYSAMTLILGEADSVNGDAYYEIAIKINGTSVSGMVAHRSKPKTAPARHRYYPLFLSGSFKAAKGDIITLDVYSHTDASYNIEENSGWSLFLVSEDGNNEQIGFSLSRSVIKNFFSTTGNSWYSIDNWRSVSNSIGSFYTSSKIAFDNGNDATILSTGFYLISANIKVRYENASTVFNLALFVNDELQQNGLTYENIKAWTTLTMHFTGVAFFTESDTVKLKITSVSKFNGAIIHKECGFSIVKIPFAEQYSGLSVILKKSYNVPIANNMPVNYWSTANDAASFSYTSGQRYNKTSGVFRVRDVGYYMVSMNLVLLANNTNSTNVTITLQAGNSRDTFLLRMNKGTTEAISSTCLLSQQVGNTIFVSTNITATTASRNITSWPTSNILIQDGSSFSVVKFPVPLGQANTYAVYGEDRSYTIPGVQELPDWIINSQNGRSTAPFTATQDGIYFVNANIKIKQFIGVVTFYFTSKKGALATSKITCGEECEEYITLNNFVRLHNGDTVTVFMHLGEKSKITLATTSRRSIFYIRPFSKSVGISVRMNNSVLVRANRNSWAIVTGYSIPDGSHGTFDARGSYLTMESMIIPNTGSYQIAFNLLLFFNGTTKRQGRVEVGVAKDGSLSETSALYTKKLFANRKNFTLHHISNVMIQKWTKITLMIRSDQDILIQEGSTVSVVFIESIINQRCEDDGPIMGDRLSPAYIASAIVGVKRNWTCKAFGTRNVTYSWFKNGQKINDNQALILNGNLEDTGKYYCEARINNIIAESNKLIIQIYDVDECHYGNHTCHSQAVCKNTPGSYNCTCKNGFYGNGKHCTDINECLLGTHNCAKYAKCRNLPGSFSCYCPSGFFGNGLDFCKDLDECLASLWNECDKHANCTNIIGSYNCTCKKGWTGDGFNCTDEDECSEKTHNCDKNAVCENRNGSHTCKCNRGYFGNGIAGNCTDVNECLYLPKTTPATSTSANANTTMGPRILYCHADATCVNADGQYGCKCKSGFTGNGTNCKDINECEAGSQITKCAVTAECFNTKGSFECRCVEGYSGDGIICRDVDECKTGSHQCDKLANCSNSYGSYQCSCPKGYIGDGKTCAIGSELPQNSDPCYKDKTALTCICKDSKKRDENILCNGLFVAIIILSVVAVVVIMFGVKYIKSRKNIKIGPVKTAKGKYIEMEEDESEV